MVSYQWPHQIRVQDCEWAWHCYGNDRHGHATEGHGPSEVKLAVLVIVPPEHCMGFIA